jgi:Protein of unknown function (DUF3309)
LTALSSSLLTCVLARCVSVDETRAERRQSRSIRNPDNFFSSKETAVSIGTILLIILVIILLGGFSGFGGGPFYGTGYYGGGGLGVVIVILLILLLLGRI